MTDDEMRAMPIPALQDEGLLFLWVTGRAMEVGRECMRVWGYTRVDEVVWVKTNQASFCEYCYNYASNTFTATTRHPHGTNRALAQPHEGAYARGRQNCDGRKWSTEIPVLGEPRFGYGRYCV